MSPTIMIVKGDRVLGQANVDDKDLKPIAKALRNGKVYATQPEQAEENIAVNRVLEAFEEAVKKTEGRK
jgi:hypothetical protein